MTAQELLDKALRRASKATAGGRNKLERAKKASISKVQTLGDTLDSTLKTYVDGVPSLERLPDFPRELVDVLVGIGNLKHDLGAIDWCRDQVRRLCKQATRQIGRSETAEDALRHRKAIYGRVSSIVNRIGPNLESFAAARKKLIQVPEFDPELPAIVVAGYPNVGKSQFVRVVSSGKPKVAPYPFTTQGIDVGHFERGWRRYLIVDTPGLLDRPMEDRNVVERQAIVALRHLADAVIFLFDPTETCGYPMALQERLLEEVREAFPSVPIVEAENKSDIADADSHRLKVSALTGDGAKEVLDAALAAIARPKGSASVPEPWEPPGPR
jgi:nucleolar GTP-binding protein